MSTSPRRALLRSLLPCAGLLFLSVACAPAIATRVAARPNAELERLHTFTVLPADDASGAGGSGAMRLGPLAARLVAEDVRSALRDRGYREATRQPDFLVSYFGGLGGAATVPAEPAAFGEWSRSRSGSHGGPDEGSLVIDVIDARTRQLVWRGQGAAPLPEGEGDASKQITRTVQAVLARFPHAAR